ncbi:hypothetical protein DPMN_145266 [Dreissena polymorpha]|uniref:Uncharacterized protein n=1 Tax=Dreissena polymorpha TaxID=45954 RepID=A0A9D4F5N0_DREPO|nr:hypothetical protein DPMN_145266 [Dreissena polymorpha]
MENLPIHGAYDRDTLIDDDEEDEEETEDDDPHSIEGRDLVAERKAVVFEGNVRELAMMKPVTTYTVKGCDQQVLLNTRCTGTAIHHKWVSFFLNCII